MSDIRRANQERLARLRHKSRLLTIDGKIRDVFDGNLWCSLLDLAKQSESTISGIEEGDTEAEWRAFFDQTMKSYSKEELDDRT